MALIDKASLLMVPSTYEAGKLYNVLPSGNRAPDNKGGAGYDQTRADFDFDRGSNAAASRINSSGLIEKYRENVLLQSNSLNTSPWVKLDGATLVSGQSGYDGSSDAWRINITNSANSGLYQAISLNGVYSYSIYAKAGDINYLGFTNFAGSSYDIFFNLSNGTIANQSGFIDATITSAGNGFYRCTLTSVNPVYLQMKPSSTASNTSTAGYIFLQDLQAESGLVATDYLNSTSVTAKVGVLIDLPRINFDANGENGALLLEPSRQQLVQYSEYWKGYFTIDANVTISVNVATSPEGVQNAGRLKYDLASRSMYKSSMGLTGEHSVSFWVKGDGFNIGKTFNLRLQGTSIDQNIPITLTSDWVRVEAQTNGLNTFELNNRNSTTIDTGSLLLYGFQIEPNASYVSSYIPNHSGTGGVTRAADVNTLSNAISLDGDFALFWEGAVFEDDIMLYGSGTNAWYMNYTTSSGRIILDELSGRKVAAYLGSGTATGVKTKILIKRVSGVHSVFANGAKLTNTTSVNSTNTLSLSSMFWAFSSSFYKGLEVNQSFVSKTELTDAECVTLTTL